MRIINEICTFAPKSKIKAGEATKDGQYIFFTSSEDESKKYNEYIYDGEGIIMGTGGNATLHYYNGKYATSTDCLVLLPDKEIIDCKYLYYFFLSNMSLLEAGFKGAGLKHTNKKYIGNIEINQIPTKDQQLRVVSILDTVTSLIVQQQKVINLLGELIKSRFVEMFGDPILNKKKWIVDSLGAYMTVLTDFSANGSYELLDNNVVMYDEPNYAIMVRTTDFENGDFTSNIKYIDQMAYELLSKSKLFGGELIMNKIGSAGKIYIMPNLNYPASLGRNAFMFRFIDQINTTFLYYLLTSDYGTKEIQQYVRGAVTKTITKDSVRKIKIIVPPIELQHRFADFVAQVDNQKATVQQSIDKLETLKKSLMQEYFG